MNGIGYLKKDHEEIFKNLLEFEDIINSNDLDYWHLISVFHSLMDLLLQHEQNEKFLSESIANDYYIKFPISKIFLDPRRIRGHIRVINEAILSKNIKSIRVALYNDGRMMISRVKEHILKEELVLDRLLFLHMTE